MDYFISGDIPYIGMIVEFCGVDIPGILTPKYSATGIYLYDVRYKWVYEYAIQLNIVVKNDILKKLYGKELLGNIECLQDFCLE